MLVMNVVHVKVFLANAGNFCMPLKMKHITRNVEVALNPTISRPALTWGACKFA